MKVTQAYHPGREDLLRHLPGFQEMWWKVYPHKIFIFLDSLYDWFVRSKDFHDAGIAHKYVISQRLGELPCIPKCNSLWVACKNNIQQKIKYKNIFIRYFLYLTILKLNLYVNCYIKYTIDYRLYVYPLL